MEKTMHFTPQGVCSRCIEITLDGDVIRSIRFTGGCSGNTQGVSKLAEGMRATDAIARLRGIRCGLKATSCPDQLAKALEKMTKETAEND